MSACNAWFGRVKYVTNCPIHHADGSPWTRVSRSARSSGTDSGRKSGRGVRLSTIGSSTTRTFSFPPAKKKIKMSIRSNYCNYNGHFKSVLLHGCLLKVITITNIKDPSMMFLHDKVTVLQVVYLPFSWLPVHWVFLHSDRLLHQSHHWKFL